MPEADGVTIVPARRMPDLLQALPPRLELQRVAWLADEPGSASAPAPDSLYRPAFPAGLGWPPPAVAELAGPREVSHVE
jgi:hypothetical protein